MFVDTNVLVYATRRASEFHAASRQSLIEAIAAEERTCISRQIMREYLAVVTRPQSGAVPFSMNKALARLDLFTTAMDILEDGPAVTQVLIELCRTVPIGGRQIHDANIVATMLAHGERRLLTFNTADFIRFTPGIELIRP